MDKFDQEKCREAAEKFKALGHPVRLWMALQLLSGEHCVREFVESTEFDFSTVSQHLSALKNAGVISCDKRGKQVFYRLKCPCIRRLLECQGKFDTGNSMDGS